MKKNTDKTTVTATVLNKKLKGKWVSDGERYGKEWYMDFHRNCCDRMIEITKAKNADYTGIGNDPFKNFKAVGFYSESWILVGFFTRMTDKFGRLASFIQKGVLLVKDESIEDSLLDLANYCILLCGYIKSLKGKNQ